MSLTERDLWTLIHGVGLGAILLLAFASAWVDLWSLRSEWLTTAGIQKRLRRLKASTSIIAIFGWLTLVVGTYIAFPWYRAKPPAGADLTSFPRSYLLANPHLAAWHTFGMEWKEHVPWMAPILGTAVAYVAIRYGATLAHEAKLRQTVTVLFTVAFLTAGVGGLFGILLTKVAPLR